MVEDDMREWISSTLLQTKQRSLATDNTALQSD